MKRKVATVLMGTFALAVSAALLSGADAYAKGKPGGGGGCPYWDIFCIDLWDPVICSDGNVYSNDCYAMRACQFDCEPYGDGGPIVVEW